MHILKNTSFEKQWTLTDGQLVNLRYQTFFVKTTTCQRNTGSFLVQITKSMTLEGLSGYYMILASLT